MVRVCILIGNGVEELDFVGVYEVLADVRKVSDYRIDVEVVTFRRRDAIRCRNGLIVIPHGVTEDFSECDILVVPGGKEFVENAMNDRQLLEAINRFYEQGKMVTSVCTGSLVLAKAGILEGRKATTHYLRMNMLRKLGAIPVRKRIVVEDRIITAAGVSASIDLGLKIIEVLVNADLSHRVAKYIEYANRCNK